MKPLLMVICLVLAVAAAVSFSNARGARKALKVAADDALQLSNKLSQATARIGEHEATLETLRIAHKLRGDDMTALSNRLETVKSEQAALKREVAQRDQRIASQEQAASGQYERVAALETDLSRAAHRIAELERELASRQAAITLTEEHFKEAANARNLSESQRAELLRSWSDPSAVRARLRDLSRKSGPGLGPDSPSDRPKLVILDDGRVIRAPAIEEN